MRYFYDFLTYANAHQTERLACHDGATFEYLQSEYDLTEESKKKIQNYLSNETCCRHDFGSVHDVDFVIAFSFGDSSRVNQQLAETLKSIHTYAPNKRLFVQQEIASHLPSITLEPLECDEYQTTYDVALRATERQGSDKRVLVVAQSWHASRCLQTCESLGLEIVALRVVHDFPSADPQPWVRNPINWIIKESHREVATGYEISQQYNLS